MSYECQVKQIALQPILSIRGHTTLPFLAATIGEFFTEVWSYVATRGGQPASDALSAWLAANGRKAAGPNWEVYWTDPGTDPGTPHWKTEVLKPLRAASRTSA
jgi:hypothetical protein